MQQSISRGRRRADVFVSAVSLKDPDDSLKRQTLQLLYKMTNSSNVEVRGVCARMSMFWSWTRLEMFNLVPSCTNLLS